MNELHRQIEKIFQPYPVGFQRLSLPKIQAEITPSNITVSVWFDNQSNAERCKVKLPAQVNGSKMKWIFRFPEGCSVRQATEPFDPKLCIVIPCYNEAPDLNDTIWSIRSTAGNRVEIIVVDDCSKEPVIVFDRETKIIRNDSHLGNAKSRHIGIEAASNPHILNIDAHMRFESGWVDKIMPKMIASPKTLWGVPSVILNSECMNMSHPHSKQYGCRLVLFDEHEGKKRIFEGAWQPEIKDQDDYEVACVMGASYFFHKEWFLNIGGTQSLRGWGSFEPFLSTKFWLSGGEVRLSKCISIGHKYRKANGCQTCPPSTASHYRPSLSDIYYNKFRATFVLLGDDGFECLSSKLPQGKHLDWAWKQFREDESEINDERQFYRDNFEHDSDWLCRKFGIVKPWESTKDLKTQALEPITA